MRLSKLCLGFALVAVLGSAALYPGREKMRSFRERVDRLDDEIAGVERENDNLRVKIDSARDDPFHRESRAREMGLTREGEKVFRVRFMDADEE